MRTMKFKEKILVRRVDSYTNEEYRDYCKRNGITYISTNLHVWAIHQQDEELAQFVNTHKPNAVVKVTGLVAVGNNYYNIIPKFLTVKTAIKNMLTPDLTDVEITYNYRYKKYYISGYHAKDSVNLFEFALDGSEID